MTTEATRRRRDGWPARLLDLAGRKVRTRRAISNGWMTLPAGGTYTVGALSRAWNDLELTGEACASCGVKPLVGKVSWTWLDLLPADAPPEIPLHDRPPPGEAR